MNKWIKLQNYSLQIWNLLYLKLWDSSGFFEIQCWEGYLRERMGLASPSLLLSELFVYFLPRDYTRICSICPLQRLTYMYLPHASLSLHLIIYFTVYWITHEGTRAQKYQVTKGYSVKWCRLDWTLSLTLWNSVWCNGYISVVSNANVWKRTFSTLF